MNKTCKTLQLLKEVKLFYFDSETYEVEQLETRIKSEKRIAATEEKIQEKEKG